MTCDETRLELLDHLRGRLDPAERRAMEAHLAECGACTAEARAEVALDDALRSLPRHPAPEALKRRLALLSGAPRRSAPPRRLVRLAAPALAASLALAVGGVVAWRGLAGRETAALAVEAVNDHLRVLASARPFEIESTGRHEVKPWFEGRLDFAPVVPAADGTELRLRGGAVGYVFDRKAAVIVYGLRRHAVTLLAFRAEGLPLPPEGPGSSLSRRSVRGFHAVLWRAGDLGYALVSDADEGELARLAEQLAEETRAVH